MKTTHTPTAKPTAAKSAGTTPAGGKSLAEKSPSGKSPSGKSLTDGQRAYEAKRAAKAGMSLDRWLASKQRAQEAEAREREKAAEQAKPPKKPGFFSRLLDRAHKPL